jgi:hypothetical protein
MTASGALADNPCQLWRIREPLRNTPFTELGQISWFTDGVDTFIQLNTNSDR